MNTHSPEKELTCLLVQRPVVDGMYKFLASVSDIGGDIFGDEVVALRRCGEGPPGTVAYTSVATPRVGVYHPSEMALMLVRRFAEPSQRLQGPFRNAVAKLEENADPTNIYTDQPIPRRETEGQKRLPSVMRVIGLRYDVPTQEPVHANFDGICTGVIGRFDLSNGSEVALVPDIVQREGMMFSEQSAACFAALQYYGVKSALPTSPSTPTVPFMRLEAGLPPNKVSSFMRGLKELLPLHLSLSGGFVTSVSHPSSV